METKKQEAFITANQKREEAESKKEAALLLTANVGGGGIAPGPEARKERLVNGLG